jgi:hypothetical protein
LGGSKRLVFGAEKLLKGENELKTVKSGGSKTEETNRSL